MPPGPVFGWLCVAHSVANIALRAAQLRASQVLLRNSVSGLKTTDKEPRASDEPVFLQTPYQGTDSLLSELSSKRDHTSIDVAAGGEKLCVADNVDVLPPKARQSKVNE